MDEAFDPDLANYPNLGALFRRKLKDGARPVDAAAPIVSPADGHVIWFGEVSPDGNMEQVKTLVQIFYSIIYLFLSPGLLVHLFSLPFHNPSNPTLMGKTPKCHFTPLNSPT